MATKKNVAAKAVKSAKPAIAEKKTVTPVAEAKKAAPAKKVAATKSSSNEPSTVAKKAVATKASVKAAPAKSNAPAIKGAAVATTKKAAPVTKKETKNLSPVKNTTTKTTPTKAAPASKAAPVKKAEEKTKVVKKVVAAPKPEPVQAKQPIKKEAPTKAKPEVVEAKPVAKKTVVNEAPVAKKAKAAPAKKVIKAPIKTITTSITGRPAPAPVPVSAGAARPVREEKKPTIVVAHRRLENKTKDGNDSRTMINYQPDFNRSILDEPVHQQGPVYRYSDEELTEFRDLITSRLEAARKELLYLQGLITRKDEAGTEDTENRYMNMEDGSGAMEREQLAQLASRQIQFINHLEKAMIRIENKTYGICRVTGKLIDKARLRAVPHATLSIEAKKYMSGK